MASSNSGLEQSLPAPAPLSPARRTTRVASPNCGMEQSLLRTWLKAIYGTPTVKEGWRVER